jgi:hypothetical protein
MMICAAFAAGWVTSRAALQFTSRKTQEIQGAKGLELNSNCTAGLQAAGDIDNR